MPADRRLDGATLAMAGIYLFDPPRPHDAEDAGAEPAASERKPSAVGTKVAPLRCFSEPGSSKPA